METERKSRASHDETCETVCETTMLRTKTILSIPHYKKAKNQAIPPFDSFPGCGNQSLVGKSPLFTLLIQSSSWFGSLAANTLGCFRVFAVLSGREVLHASARCSALVSEHTHSMNLLLITTLESTHSLMKRNQARLLLRLFLPALRWARLTQKLTHTKWQWIYPIPPPEHGQLTATNTELHSL